MKKLGRYYQVAAVILLNTLILFILINIVALMVEGPVDKKIASNCVIPSMELLISNPELLTNIHDGKSKETIAKLYGLAQNFKSHPVLEHMTIPEQNEFYHIGFENCRYNRFVNESNIRNYINNGTWLMGGSTAYGQGVADDETIGFYLNQLDSSSHYLNFGSPGYHLKLNLQKLVLLLQKGYRPKNLIFLEGLNDITQITSSTFEPSETPARPYNAYCIEFGIESYKPNRNLFYALPAVRLYYEFKAQSLLKQELPGTSHIDTIYKPDALYNTAPYLHYMKTLLRETPANDELLRKTATYYKESIAFLDKLSEAYGFRYTIFFQPNGIMYPQNPFIRNKSSFQYEFMNYTAYRYAYQFVKQQAAKGQFANFFDISDIVTNCQYPFVDLTHYSKFMNKMVAEQILQKTASRRDTVGYRTK